jgi:hypothetical protein
MPNGRESVKTHRKTVLSPIKAHSTAFGFARAPQESTNLSRQGLRTKTGSANNAEYRRTQKNRQNAGKTKSEARSDKNPQDPSPTTVSGIIMSLLILPNLKYPFNSQPATSFIEKGLEGKTFGQRPLRERR